MVLEYIEGRMIPATASAAVTAGQIVELTGDNQVAPTGAVSDKVAGVALMDAAVNDAVTVVTGGVVEVTAAGAIAAGGLVQAAAAGKVAAFTATKQYTDSNTDTVDVDDDTMIVGKAYTASALDGDAVTIKLKV